MTDVSPEADQVDDGPPTLTFHYLKSPRFRTVHVDGALGGPSPSLPFITMTMYSERHAVPREMTHTLNDDGSVGEVAATEGRSGIVRELEMCAVFDPRTAKQLARWLDNQADAVIQQYNASVENTENTEDDDGAEESE